ncbi:MAG: hypothetical protein AAB215_08035 [Planctomycetota bacterium]
MRNRCALIVAGVGLAAMLATFPDIVFEGRRPYARDYMPYVLPDRAFLQEAWRRGDTALWNPNFYFGVPQVAVRGSPVFYPPAWPFRPFGSGRGTDAYHLLHLLLAYAGAYGLLRTLYCRTGVAIPLGLTYAFSGYLLSLPDFAPWCAWIPISLALAIRAGEAPRLLPAAFLLGLSLACAFLAGGMEEVYVPLLAAPFAIAVRAPPGRERLRRALLGTLAAGAFAFALAAPHLLSLAEFLAGSDRAAAFAGDTASGWSSPPLQSLEAVFPFLFGRTIPDRAFFGDFLLGPGEPEFWNPSLYVGLLPLILAPFAFRKDRRAGAFFLGLGLFSLVAAWGRHVPLHGWLRAVLPLFDHFRFPARMLVFTTISVIALAGLGAEACLERGRRKPIVLAAVAVAAASLLLWAAAGSWLPHLPAVFGRTALVAALVAAAAAAARGRALTMALSALAIVQVADVASSNRSVLPASSPALQAREPLAVRAIRAADPAGGVEPFRVYRIPPNIRYVEYVPEAKGPWASGYEAARAQDADTLLGNVAEAYGLSLVHGFTAARSGRFDRLMKDYALGNPEDFLALAGARYILTPLRAAPWPYPRIFQSRPDDLRIYCLPLPGPRAFLVPRFKFVKGPAEAASEMAKPGFDPWAVAILEGEGGEAAVSGQGRPPVLPRIVRYRNGEVVVEISGGPGGVLVLSDSWAPGWRAEVDGTPAEIHPADVAFRGVVLPAGPHRVRFAYRPRSVLAGGGLAAAALLIGCLLWVRARRKILEVGLTFPRKDR